MYHNLNPLQISELIYSPLKKGTPLQFNPNLPSEEVEGVKFLQFCKRFLLDVQPRPIKLTQKGNLPRKFMHTMYDYRLYPSEYVDNGTVKLLREEDLYILSMTHYALRSAGFVKKYSNKLSITKKGEKYLDNDAKLYQELLKAFANKFNWSYLSYFEDKIGQSGWAYLMYLFIRYGDEVRPIKFYSDEYQLMLPELLREVPQNNPHVNPQERFLSNVDGKFFGRFCSLFELLEVHTELTEDKKEQVVGVSKSALVDLVFRIEQ